MEIVLLHPEIPQNTGSIARTCAATRTPLHIIKPMKFEINEKRVRRAGLDYWPFVNLTEHESWEAYLAGRADATSPRLWFITKSGKVPYYRAEFKVGDGLVFGCESSGLPPHILTAAPQEQRLAIPMQEPRVRSLNLSNAVSILLYEARRQLNLDEGVPTPLTGA